MIVHPHVPNTGGYRVVAYRNQLELKPLIINGKDVLESYTWSLAYADRDTDSEERKKALANNIAMCTENKEEALDLYNALRLGKYDALRNWID